MTYFTAIRLSSSDNEGFWLPVSGSKSFTLTIVRDPTGGSIEANDGYIALGDDKAAVDTFVAASAGGNPPNPGIAIMVSNTGSVVIPTSAKNWYIRYIKGGNVYVSVAL